jgi:hypothetical protein
MAERAIDGKLGPFVFVIFQIVRKWRQRGQAPFVQSTLRAAPRQTEPVPFAKKTCRTPLSSQLVGLFHP